MGALECCCNIAVAAQAEPRSLPASPADAVLCLGAVCSACREIVDRLKPIRAKLAAHATFKEVVNAAYFQRVDLSAHGFYITPHVDGEHCCCYLVSLAAEYAINIKLVPH